MTGLLIDNFAGGGGASFALMEAFGRKVDIAINHNAEALAMHEANHPETNHILSDVFEVDPFEVCGGRPIDAAWFSPDCTHFSRAKGGKPRSKKIRALAWVVLKWASLPEWQRPRVIFLENVEEFETWGPLDDEGYPVKDREGETYRFWRKSLEKRGYVIEARKLRACDYGAPTIRKRFFMVARCDGEPIVWPEITHRDPRKPRPPMVRAKLKPWRTAAEVIDWSIPCPSIFERKKPLADNTLRRIARGVMRYVVENPKPFIVRVTQSSNQAPVNLAVPLPTITTARGGELAIVSPSIVSVAHGDSGGRREYAAEEPLGVITAGGQTRALVGATLVQTSYGERQGQAPRCMDIEMPLGTVVAGGGKHALVCAHLNTNRNAEKPYNGADEPVHTITAGGAHINLVAAFLAQHNGGPRNEGLTGRSADAPLSTTTTRGTQQAIVAAHLLHQYTSNTNGGQGDPLLPAKTITTGGHHSLVTSFLLKYFGTDQDPRLESPLHTVTTKDRFGVVIVHIGGEPYYIADIGMRMLTPRELFNAQGFSPDYLIDLMFGGKPMTKSTQIRLVGNSVSPPPAIALAVANAPIMSRLRRPPVKERVVA